MPLPKELTTVTKVSKYLALLLFITLPISAFFIGKDYQKNLDKLILKKYQQVSIPTSNKTKIPSIAQQSDDTVNWKSHTFSSWSSNLTIKYPPQFVVKDELSGMTIANSKKTLNSYESSPMTFSDSNNMIISAQVSDLHYDTLSPSEKHSIQDFIQANINMTFGTPRLISRDTKIQFPWKNQNGDTYDGRKWYIDDVLYEHVQINGEDSALIKKDNQYIYYIPSKSGKSYTTFYIKPINTSLMNTAKTILNSFTVTENNPPYTGNK